MTTDLHGLVSQMADELDRCQQLLLDDRRQRHPLADHARAVLARWGRPAALAAAPEDEPSDDEIEVWADQQGFIRGHGDHPCGFWIDDGDAGAFARAALARWGRQPAPPAEGEVPQGWHMLCDIEPEPGTMCDWVIMAPWGCDHGNGEWRHFDSSPVPEFFDLPAGCGVHGKGFAGRRGLMVSDPKLTAWRARPLTAGEVK